MEQHATSIGFIGGGNMGEALIGAVLASGVFAREMVWVSDPRSERMAFLQSTYGIQATSDNAALFRQCGVVVMAVKPQQMSQALAQITASGDYGDAGRKVVLSIAAGYPIRKIESALYGPLSESQQSDMPIIRVMPNTPALVLTGMSGMSLNRHATPQDRQLAVQVLESMGKVIEFEEKQLDAVTALSGSGPAYVFYLAEAMIAAGIRVGLSAEDSAVLTIQTVKGAVALMEASDESPQALREKVTSPGGTTAAALSVFKERDFKDTVIEAIRAATARAAELASSNG